MEESQAWRELFRSDDLAKTRAVATAIAAMEYEARIRSLSTDAAIDEVEGEIWPAEFPEPYSVEVPEEDWPTLNAALDEIVREQDEFDAELDRGKKEAGAISGKAAFLFFVIAILVFTLIWIVAKR